MAIGIRPQGVEEMVIEALATNSIGCTFMHICKVLTVDRLNPKRRGVFLNRLKFSA